MGGAFARYFVPAVVGLAPVLLLLVTWAPSGRWLLLQAYLRAFSIPLVAVELLVFLVAIHQGLLRSLTRWNWSWPVLAALAALLVVSIATALTAPDQGIAITLTGFWIAHGLFALSVAFLCGRLFDARHLVRAYMAGFAIVAALLILFAAQVPDWSTFDWRSGLPAFSHVRHAGYYFAAMAGLGIGVMAIARRRGEWTWAFATATVAIGLSFWTGSRGAVLAIAGALAIGALIVPAMRSLRVLGGGLASMVLAVLLVSLAPATNHPMMGITRTVEATTQTSDVTTGRTAIWRNVIGAIQERPLFGYGEGQMRTVAPFHGLVQPHNVILQVTLAWGIVGLLCILPLAIAFARRAIPAVRREGGFLVPPFLAMAAIAILALYDASLYYALPISIFMASGALIAAQFSPARSGQRVSRPAGGEVIA